MRPGEDERIEVRVEPGVETPGQTYSRLGGTIEQVAYLQTLASTTSERRSARA